LVFLIRRNLREPGHHLKSMHELWHPVRLKVEMASAVHYKCVLCFQLRKPEATGVEIWPKVMLVARCFP